MPYARKSSWSSTATDTELLIHVTAERYVSFFYRIYMYSKPASAEGLLSLERQSRRNRGNVKTRPWPQRPYNPFVTKLSSNKL